MKYDEPFVRRVITDHLERIHGVGNVTIDKIEIDGNIVKVRSIVRCGDAKITVRVGQADEAEVNGQWTGVRVISIRNPIRVGPECMN
jgi:hypothetical protein